MQTCKQRPREDTERRLNFERRLSAALQSAADHAEAKRYGMAEDSARYAAWLIDKYRRIRRVEGERGL